MDIKEALKKTWNFLWYEDSLASWIVSLALAFIIVKFIFFPILTIALGTSLPLVVVESESMHHEGSVLGKAFNPSEHFENWWESDGSWYEHRGLQKNETLDWSLRSGLEIGDIVLIVGSKTYKKGDIIVFNVDSGHPIIHRIVRIDERGEDLFYFTKGDNNVGYVPDKDTDITEDQIIGKAILRISKFGWVKLIPMKIWENIRG